MLDTPPKKRKVEIANKTIEVVSYQAFFKLSYLSSCRWIILYSRDEKYERKHIKLKVEESDLDLEGYFTSDSDKRLRDRITMVSSPSLVHQVAEV